MIITSRIPLNQILSSLQGLDNIFIIGCGECATLCKTGGENETAEMADVLSGWGKNITGRFVSQTPCSVNLLRREMIQYRKQIADSSSVLILACGAGVQSAVELMNDRIVLPGLNSLFLGNVKRQGVFDERCSLCGECVLARTMGICPITRCAKGLLNGPCGGSRNGKCEVSEDRDCAWHLIYQRAEKLGMMETVTAYHEMKNFEVDIKPGMLDISRKSQHGASVIPESLRKRKMEFSRRFHQMVNEEQDGTSSGRDGNPISLLDRKLSRGEFVATCEIIPPKGINVEEPLRQALQLKEWITAFSVNENPGSIMRMSSLSFSSLLVNHGLEPILHLTTRERNRLALQSELLGAYAMGIKNTLTMTGDHQSVGDHREAKPVYDLDSVQLIKLTSRLTQGFDYGGNALDGTPSFFIGGVVNPGSDMPEYQLNKMEMKVKAGARFFITQGIFDVSTLERFLDMMYSRRIKAHIIAGIIILKSEKTALYMMEKIPGIIIPKTIIEKFEKYSDKRAVSLEITRDLVEKCTKITGGIHFMPIGWYDMVPETLSGLVSPADGV